MLNITVETNRALRDAINSNKEVGQFDPKKLKPLFDVISYINSVELVSLINGFGLNQYRIDSRLACLVWPESVKFESDCNHSDLLIRANAVEPKDVSPTEFEQAQLYLFGRLKANINLDKTLADVRNKATLCPDLTKNIITNKGLKYEVDTRVVLPLDIDCLFNDFYYNYTADYASYEAQVKRALAVAMMNLVNSI